MSVCLGIFPLVNPSVSPLEGALYCVLPPLALLCLLRGVTPRVAAAVQAFQANLMPCCRKRGFAPGQRPPELCSLQVRSTLQEPCWRCT